MLARPHYVADKSFAYESLSMHLVAKGTRHFLKFELVRLATTFAPKKVI